MFKEDYSIQPSDHAVAALTISDTQHHILLRFILELCSVPLASLRPLFVAELMGLIAPPSAARHEMPIDFAVADHFEVSHDLLTKRQLTPTLPDHIRIALAANTALIEHRIALTHYSSRDTAFRIQAIIGNATATQ